MSKSSLIIVFLLVVSVVSSSFIKKLSQKQLSQQLENNKKVWLVFSGESSNQAIEEISEIFRGMFNVAFVEESSSQLSLKIYSDDRATPKKYEGQMKSEEIINFVLSNLDEVVEARSQVAKALKDNQQFLQRERQRVQKQWKDQQQLREKSDTLVLNSQNWNTFTGGRQPWLINFYEANNSACINLNKQWELISTQFKGTVKVAKVNITEQGNQVLEEQIMLQKYPSVRFYRSGPKKVSQFSQFEGVHKRFSIQQWLNSKLKEKSDTVEIPRLNQENYQNLCKSTKNTCIIVFLQDQQPQISKKIQQISLKNLKKPITFLISKKGQQQQFAEQTGVTSYPDTVMMYCKLKKVWRMQGLDFTAINDAIGQISLGNRNNFQRYNFLEELK